MNNYHKLSFNLAAHSGFADILMYELGEIGFESFEEKPGALEAYIQSPDYNENLVKDVLEAYNQQFYGVTYVVTEIAAQNWNAEWESSYQPIEIDHKLRIRANFHEPATGFEHEIVIIPKMSFGTGHHETTRLMALALYGLDVQGKSLLDMGCGTGILAIYAARLGAGPITAIDIEDFAYENTLENCNLNGFSNIRVEKGGAEVIPPVRFNIILANINKNVLLEQIPLYAQHLEPGGQLLLSGFFESDCAGLIAAAEKAGMQFVSRQLLHNWACLQLCTK